MKPQAVRRREQQQSYNRALVLQTALDLFSSHGFHDVSMHRIAEESGFSIGTLYKFFQDKEALYGALINDYAGKFSGELLSALEKPEDEVECIRAYVAAKGKIFENNRPMLRLYFAETRNASFDFKSSLETELRAMYDGILQKLARVFQRGIKRGLFRRLMEPYYLAVAVDSLTNSFLFLWLENPDRHPYAENVETIMRLAFENLLVYPEDKNSKRKPGGKT